jgi:predicted kinase
MKSFLELVEETKQGEKHHVMTFGRMNPPTTGHLKLIDKVKDVAKKHNATHSVVVSHSQDTKKNPLSGEQKVKHLKRYSPGTHIEKSSAEAPTILHHAAKAHGASHLHVVVGSDRVKEMHHLLHKYNGVEGKHGKYHFKKITVHSAGQRDPDAEGSSGMSGTKMRHHAASGNFKEFRKGVPEHVSDKHAKELMHDTRKGMGLHENINHGSFKAIFVTGGPGSGKDIIIREAIAESRIVELNFIQAHDYLADKQKLSEKTSDFRREAIRRRGPLVINGPADNIDKMSYIKEELEELGYDTMMVFVDTTNEVSKERNSALSRMMVESIRYEKWLKSQQNTKYFKEMFENFIGFDNTGNIDTKEEDITEVYQFTKQFLDAGNISDIASDWKNRNVSLFKEEKNVKSTNQFFKVKTNSKLRAADLGSISPDNRASDPNADNIKWDGNKTRGSYTFRTYTEEKPVLKTSPEPKESNFSKDKEKVNKKRFTDVQSVNQRVRNMAGIGPEFDTRQQGTVYPMSGLGDVTYREQKEFSSFRKQFKEAIDDPGANDMGVAGVLGGSTNKEPLETYKDTDKNISIQTKKQKKGNGEKNVYKK